MCSPDLEKKFIQLLFMSEGYFCGCLLLESTKVEKAKLLNYRPEVVPYKKICLSQRRDFHPATKTNYYVISAVN